MRFRWSSGPAWPACLLLAMCFGGCGVLNAADPAAEQKSLEYQTQFEELLPALVEQAGAGLRIEDLREESCLRPEIEQQHLDTRRLGIAAVSVQDSSTLNAALDRVGSRLDAEGGLEG